MLIYMNRLRPNVETKKILWNRYYNNKTKTLCFCGCGRTIPADSYILKNIFNCKIENIHYDDNLEYGHIIPHKYNGSVNKDNLRPICSTCNNSMKTMNLYEYCFINSYITKDDDNYDPMDICSDEEDNNKMILEHDYDHCLHICSSTTKCCRNKKYVNGFCKKHLI